MHIGSFDNEPATVALMDTYLEQNGYVNDINKDRLHHEIYMSDARKVAPEKWKTVIRHPIKKSKIPVYLEVAENEKEVVVKEVYNGVWIFMLIMDLLLPFTMIGFGRYFMKKAPGDIFSILVTGLRCLLKTKRPHGNLLINIVLND